MKVTVFGATGGTGKHVVEQALAAGHEVTAVARNVSEVEQRDGLTVLQGDVLDFASVEQAVAGSDAVVSVLGVADRRKPTKLFSEGVGNMVRAMKASGTKRIIALSADGVEPNPAVNIGQRLVIALAVARILKHLYGDMLEMEHVLADSETDWTVVRPPRLSGKEHTGTYQVSTGEPGPSSGISRADLADYIVTHLADGESYRKLVWITS
jgi:putative NADH-flavin reductase